MTTFTLKIIAILCMVIDHIGYYFGTAPEWFRMIGRISYPLFLFCMVWGFSYTKNRKVYLFRLYLMSLLMTLFSNLVDHFFPSEYGFAGNHNIFMSILLVGLVITAIELSQKDWRKGALLILGLFGTQVLFYLLRGLPPFNALGSDILRGIIPNLVLSEYGFDFVVLGVLMYFTKERKEVLGAVYLLFCIYQFSMEMNSFGGVSQSLMVAALPFMLAYNNKKGPGLKYFFYFFYPLHAFLLYYLANFVFVSL